MKTYKIEITQDQNKLNFSRKNDGFTVIELMGFISVIQSELIDMYRKMLSNDPKVDIQRQSKINVDKIPADDNKLSTALKHAKDNGVQVEIENHQNRYCYYKSIKHEGIHRHYQTECGHRAEEAWGHCKNCGKEIVKI